MTNKELPKEGDRYRAKDDKDFEVEIVSSYGNLLGATVLYIGNGMTGAASMKLNEFEQEFEKINSNDK
jgi:hypothetical protein